jgi:G3E family GTPase
LRLDGVVCVVDSKNIIQVSYRVLFMSHDHLVDSPSLAIRGGPETGERQRMFKVRLVGARLSQTANSSLPGRQIAASDVILLNKTDLVQDETLFKEIEDRIAYVQPRAHGGNANSLTNQRDQPDFTIQAHTALSGRSEQHLRDRRVLRCYIRHRWTHGKDKITSKSAGYSSTARGREWGGSCPRS